MVAAVGAAILFVTLRPSEGGLRTFQLCLLCGRDPIADAVRNVILFVPLGMGLGLATRAPRRAFIAAALLSAAIELLQRWIPGRDPSLGDIITNSSGAALGLLMVSFPRVWIRSSGPLALAAGVASSMGLMAGGLLLQPHFHPKIRNAQWTQQVGFLEWYRGKVLDVALGSMSLPPHHVSNPDSVAHLLASGAPLRIRLVAGPRVHGLAPLFSMFDEGWNEVFLLGPKGHDIVFRYAMWARHFRLDEPDLHARNLSLGPAGDTVRVVLWRQDSGYCVAVRDEARCGIGYTVGSEWALVWFTTGLPMGLRHFLDFFWVALLAVPCGFWAARDWRSAIGIGALGIALILAPPLTGLLATPAVEWIALVVGLAAGATAGRVLRGAIVDET